MNTVAKDLAVVFCLLALVGIGKATAQEVPGDSATEEESAAEEEWSGTRITFHGYLTQAYAQTDGHQLLGISEDGTADYRTAAIQIRADVSEKDAFVVQFSHERIGDSPIQAVKEDVGLDWVFYEHRFKSSSIKLGRVQIPFGIYNEVLDVGTLLPFYRPSRNFYGDGGHSSETVDGVVLTHRFELGGNWGLAANLHYGNWQFAQSDRQGNFEFTDIEQSVGTELWLETPVSGLRIGAGGMRFDVANPTGKIRGKSYHVSAAGDFGRFSMHAEHKGVEAGSFDGEMNYGQMGIKLTDQIEINAQLERFYFDRGFGRLRADNDRAAGINYFFRSDLVLKAEHHWNEGFVWLEDLPPIPPKVTPKTRYWIVSLSTSF